MQREMLELREREAELQRARNAAPTTVSPRFVACLLLLSVLKSLPRKGCEPSSSFFSAVRHVFLLWLQSLFTSALLQESESSGSVVSAVRLLCFFFHGFVDVGGKRKPSAQDSREMLAALRKEEDAKSAKVMCCCVMCSLLIPSTCCRSSRQAVAPARQLLRFLLLASPSCNTLVKCLLFLAFLASFCSCCLYFAVFIPFLCPPLRCT
jgi:hypothetical protein